MVSMTTPWLEKLRKDSLLGKLFWTVWIKQSPSFGESNDHSNLNQFLE
jgi:hypothetical protein